MGKRGVTKMGQVLLKTGAMYILIIVAMKIMGKRQIGQLQLSELVTITMLSELATVSLADPEISFLHCAAAIGLIVVFEICAAFLTVKNDFFRKLLDGTPSAIISRGNIDQKELKHSRITLGELVSSMRSQGIYNLSDVNYAFIEQNGSISFIPKKTAQQPSFSDFGMSTEENGVQHIVIMDGKVSAHSLSEIGKDKKWLKGQIKKSGHKNASEIFFMGCDDNGQVQIVAKE